MANRSALFAAVDADPAILVDEAIDRLVEFEGQPTRSTPQEVRFRHSKSLWIDRRTGRWRDWANGTSGRSWQLARELARMTVSDIARLYGVDADAPLVAKDRRLLEAKAKRRLHEAARADALQRASRRREAQRLRSEARRCEPGDPAGRYLIGRGLTNLAGLWFHPDPVTVTANNPAWRLAPSLIYQVIDSAGELCAVHAVQLDPSRDRRLSSRWAKISIGSLTDGYVRFGPSSPIVCLGEGAETVASVAETVPHWRCLASCSGIRFVDADPDIASARQILLLAERGMENTVRQKGHALLDEGFEGSVYLVHVPESVPGDTADLNDALQLSPALVLEALSFNQLEALHVAP